jgi:N-acetylneuraminate synthase
LEPAELTALVTETERAWQALGAPRIGPKESEREVLRLRRSLFVVADVAEGDVVTAENVRSIRPSGGLPPAELSTVLGRQFRTSAARGTPLTWDLI